LHARSICERVAFASCVEEAREEDDRSLRDILVIHGDAKQIERVVDGGNRRNSNKGTKKVAFAAVQARVADYTTAIAESPYPVLSRVQRR